MVDGQRVESIFDMWIKWSTGEEEFIEVKYSNELDPNNRKAFRSIRQTNAQRLWCEKENYLFSVKTEKDIRKNPVFLSNMKHIVPYLRNQGRPLDIDQHKVLKLINQGVNTIGKIENTPSDMQSSRIRETIYWLLFLGKCNVDTLHAPLGRVIQRCGFHGS